MCLVFPDFVWAFGPVKSRFGLQTGLRLGSEAATLNDALQLNIPIIILGVSRPV